MASTSSQTTLEWFGATTFRLCTKGITIFLDTWLEKPSAMPQHLSIEAVSNADYIFISHAHFDHLPGADRIAIRTGATVIGNCEAINVLRMAGVSEAQLMPVAGGERIPLYTREVREKALRGEVPLRPAPPAAHPLPHPSLAAMSVDVWPSLHCLMPSHDKIPEVMDTARVYTGAAHPFLCTFDVNNGMKYGLLQLETLIPREKMDERMCSFVDYVSDRKQHVFSHHDGGQLMFNILIDGKALLRNAHLGAYEGIIKALEPKPTVAILGIAGRANLNGRPWDGSAAQFALEEVKWLDQPRQVIWCLHDESCIPPYRIETKTATETIEENTKSRILDMTPAQSIVIEL